MFKPNLGRVAVYLGILGLIYALSTRVGGLENLLRPALILTVFMMAGDTVEAARGEKAGLAVRIVGLALAVGTVPLALVILGGGTALIAPRLERFSRTARGAGLMVFLYGLSLLPPLEPIGSVFTYAGLFLLAGYLLAELHERGHSWAEPVERNLIGVGVLGGALGLYASFRGTLSESHPSLVFYGEWLALLLAVITAGSLVHAHVSGSDPEEYLISQWRRHESKTARKLGKELENASKAIEDFVVRGRRGPLTAFLAYYGARVFEEREEFEELVARIADYEGRKTSPLTPPWIRRVIERRELERRARIVEEVLEELRKMMGWEK
ncbi:hypothetical protein E3E27_07660 [Thermococcus sp. MV11]|nr:hypothetical protein [Thermococcus sp. MV11]NJE04001.1 hypothetical protein [Thermococcus sp. MV11]